MFGLKIRRCKIFDKFHAYRHSIFVGAWYLTSLAISKREDFILFQIIIENTKVLLIVRWAVHPNLKLLIFLGSESNSRRFLQKSLLKFYSGIFQIWQCDQVHFDTYWKGPRNQYQLEDFRQFCYWFRQDNINITAWTKYISVVNKCLILNLEIEKKSYCQTSWVLICRVN